MLQIKNTLGGGKPEGLYAWKKHEIGSELKEINESVSTLPYDFYNGSAVVLNGEIHILGGSISKTSHHKWNGSSWVNVSTLPYNFHRGSAVVLDGEIHIFGGYATSVGLNHYKWDGSSWVSVSTLPYDFYNGSAVVLNNEIHILGSGNNPTSHYKWDGSSWLSVSTLPYNFYQGSAVVLNNEIHILGSNEGRTSHYKWNGTLWTSVSTLPYRFYYGAAVVFNGEIHILGGSDNATKYYKWDGTSWTSVSTLPYNFYQGSSVVLNGGIHILGSSDSSYRTVHYLIIGYVPVYTFLDYIVSDKETAFPDGGEKGGYWYEKVAEAKVVTGSITLSSSSNTLNIEHGLGKAPTKFAVILSSGTEIYRSGTISALYDGTNCYLNWYGEVLSSYEVMGGTGTPIISDTNISIPYYRSNWVAATYQWIAVAE